MNPRALTHTRSYKGSYPHPVPYHPIRFRPGIQRVRAPPKLSISDRQAVPSPPTHTAFVPHAPPETTERATAEAPQEHRGRLRQPSSSASPPAPTRANANAVAPRRWSTRMRARRRNRGGGAAAAAWRRAAGGRGARRRGRRRSVHGGRDGARQGAGLAAHSARDARPGHRHAVQEDPVQGCYRDAQL
jgi:hypothetical protein